MRILYGAGNLDGSNVRLSHFLRCTEHEVMVAGFYKNSDCLTRVHWLLDSFKSKLKLDQKRLTLMIDDVINWEPDLVITDYEPICAHVAKVLEIPLISCSPMHLLDGAVWEENKRTLFYNEITLMGAFEHAQERLVWSPFGLLDNPPQLLPGFQWLTPYPDPNVVHTRNLKSIELLLKSKGKGFNTGDSGNICQDMLDNKDICVFNSPFEPECFMNGIFVESLGLGMYLGQAEEDMKYAAASIDKFLSKNFTYSLNKTPEFLHERLNNVP